MRLRDYLNVLGDGELRFARNHRTTDQRPKICKPAKDSAPSEVAAVKGRCAEEDLVGLRRLNFRRGAFVERERGREDDEIHHEIRGESATADIELAIRDFLFGRPAPIYDLFAPFGFLLLHFLRTLPVKEIRTDRGAEDRYERAPTWRGSSAR